MRDPETGPLGPETARTIREIEDYWHRRMARIRGETIAEYDTTTQSLIALRDEWSGRPDADH